LQKCSPKPRRFWTFQVANPRAHYFDGGGIVANVVPRRHNLHKVFVIELKSLIAL
jgi:hypothetical protein